MEFFDINLVIIGLCIIQIGGVILPFKPGYTLKGAVIISNFTSVSLAQCQDHCLSRKKCLSVELDRSYGLCRLTSSDSSSNGTQLTRTPGTVYSEKAAWVKKSSVPQCDNCSLVETCYVENGGAVTCDITECSAPEKLDPDSNILGNRRTVGAKTLHSCNDSSDISQTSVCEENGEWSAQQLECPKDCGDPGIPEDGATDKSNGTKYLAVATFNCNTGFSLDGNSTTVCNDDGNWSSSPPQCKSEVTLQGKKFKIFAKDTNKFWHYNGNGNKIVTSFWQPNDPFVHFVFEKQGDGSYKIWTVAKPSYYMYDGYGVTGAYQQYIFGKQNTDDDHVRFLVSMETQDFYRIQTKATGRYVRLDSDQYVSSRFNTKDDRSLFQLLEIQ